MSIIPYKINVINNTMIDFNKIEDISQPKSDHALIRIEFENFVILSYNIMNSEDDFNIRSILNNLNIDEKFKETLIGIIKKESDERVKKIFTLFNTQYLPNESKKVIICFQGIGKNMELILGEYFKQFTIYRSDPDLRSQPDGLKLYNERRVTLVPVGDYFRVRNSDANLNIKNVDFAFKPVIHINLEVANMLNINLFNVQIHPLSNDSQIIEFLDEINKFENVLIVGSFSRPLRRFELLKYFIGNKFYFVEPNNPTNIRELPEGDNEDKSNIVDKVLFKVSSYLEDVKNLEDMQNKKSSIFDYFIGNTTAPNIESKNVTNEKTTNEKTTNEESKGGNNNIKLDVVPTPISKLKGGKYKIYYN